MARKKTNKVDLFEQALNELTSKNPTKSTKQKEKLQTSEIVDIMTFCNGPEYLNLPGNKLNLFLTQRVILKCFYKNTIGNEGLNLTKEEWEWLYDNQEDETLEDYKYERNIKDVIRKMLELEEFHDAKKQGIDLNEGVEEENQRAEYFSMLLLVLGRRAGKTLMASIITSYEAYKLIVINNGDPHGYYGLPSDDEIAIINVALSQAQAGRLFTQIQAKLRNSPFFQGRVGKSTLSEIYLLTDSDLKKKEEKTNIDIQGSIKLLCGHSNPDSLAGYNAILILFDEIAFYDDSGKVTGTYFFNRLKPSLSKFYKYNAGRIVMISSPNTRSGIFYDMFKESKEDDSILSFQLPTWCVNDDISFKSKDLARDRKNNLDMFAIEFGAQWAVGGTYGNFFEEGLIQRCLRTDIGPHRSPQRGFNYYAHVDPSNGENNYSMVLIAKKRYTNNRGQKRWKVYLAGVWIWKPVPGIGIQYSEIDNHVLTIAKRYRVIQLTYDDYQSAHSLQMLRAHGVNCRKIQYNRATKQKIYRHLKMLMQYQPEPELYLYEDEGNASLLVSEMMSLKFQRIQRGVKIMPDKHGDVPTDDVIDCLAGACAEATHGIIPNLPMSTTVRMRF